MFLILKKVTHCFFYQGFFFHGHWTTHRTKGEGGNHFLFHCTTSTRSRTFRHLFATFNRTACIYQTVTWWYLPPSRITIWLTDDVKLVFVYLLDVAILGFCYSSLDTGNRWTQIYMDYHPCHTSKPTNQVC